MLIHFHSPSSLLYQKFQQLLQNNQNRASDAPVLPLTKRHPCPVKLRYGIPAEEWPTVLRRVVENQKPLLRVADDYGVSYETVRRTVKVARQQSKAHA